MQTNTPASRLAAQRLQRSQDRLRTSQTTSAASYGAWFTPSSEPPVRRPLTSDTRKASLNQQQQQALMEQQQAPAAAPFSGGWAPAGQASRAPAHVPPRNGAGPAANELKASSPGVEAEPLDEASTGAMTLQGALGNFNCRGSVNVDMQASLPDTKTTANPVVGAAPMVA